MIPERRQRSARWAFAAGLLGLLTVLAAGSALAQPLVPASPGAEGETLETRMSSKRITAFEERLTNSISSAMSRYVSPGRFVLAVKVVWNPNVVPLVERPELGPDKQKLPGFPIFVRAPDSPAVDESNPPFSRMEVKVLLDETLPEYYERFVRKLVPIVARFDFNRGDQVVVLKETFPVRKAGEEPPTLPEKELMNQLGETPLPGQQPPPFTASPAGGEPPLAPYAQQPTATSPAEAAQMAYDEGRYTDALRIAETAFQRATTNRERAYYLGLAGSVYYTMNNREGAQASWQRALVFDPANMEIHQAMNYLQSQTPSEKKP